MTIDIEIEGTLTGIEIGIGSGIEIGSSGGAISAGRRMVGQEDIVLDTLSAEVVVDVAVGAV